MGAKQLDSNLVAYARIGNTVVSTVMFKHAGLTIFETAIFPPDMNIRSERFYNYNDAIKGHDEIVRKVSEAHV
jgi:hypothetical protein